MKTDLNLDKITQILQSVLPSDQEYVALHEPFFSFFTTSLLNLYHV